MHSAGPKKTTDPGNGVHLCSRCGCTFPNVHPSPRHRRAHKRVCGTVEGYTIEVDSGAATLSHSYGQHSAVSSFSDDEHGSDRDSKSPSMKGVISRSVSQGGCGRVLNTSGTSADDVFADAVSEFVDASLADEELFLAVNAETVPHNGAPSFTAPAEDVAVTEGRVQGSVYHENSSESLSKKSTTLPVLDQVTSFSEISAKIDDAMTDTSEENKRSNAFEEPAGLETELDVAPVIVLAGKDDGENSEVMTEEMTIKDPNAAESKLSRNEEKCDVKSGTEIFGDDYLQEGIPFLRSTEEKPARPETGFACINDASEVNVASAVVMVGIDASENSVVVTEKMTSKNPFLSENETCQNQDKLDVKSGFKTLVDDRLQQGVPLLRSSEEIFGIKAEDIPQIQNDEILTESVTESFACTFPVISEVVYAQYTPESNNVVLANNQLEFELSCEDEGGITFSLSSDNGIGALPDAAVNETIEMPLVCTESGHVTDDLTEKYRNSLTRVSVNYETKHISTTEQNWQAVFIGGNDTVSPEDGLTSITISEDSVPMAENGTKTDNMSLNISSEEPMSMSPVVRVQSVGTTSEASLNQLEKIVQSAGTDTALEVSSDVKASSSDTSVENATGISKEVTLDDAEGPVHVIDTNTVGHDVLLEKLQEDPSDGEPIESLTSTESSSQCLGNNQVDNSKDSSAKYIEKTQDPEKDTVISVAGPLETSSPNGSSLDGNWGSVSVLSSLSEAAGDVKKPKEAHGGQSSDKYDDTFDPPILMTLVVPQALKTSAASSSSNEVQNPQQPDAAKAAWFPFPSVTSPPNDSHGRKKEEIIAKVTNWSTSKQNSPLKTLLSKAKGNSTNPSVIAPKDSTSVKNGTSVPTVNTIFSSEEPDHTKDKLDSSSKDWSPHVVYSNEIKQENRKVKGRPYWAPFMCCSSLK